MKIRKNSLLLILFKFALSVRIGGVLSQRDIKEGDKWCFITDTLAIVNVFIKKCENTFKHKLYEGSN